MASKGFLDTFLVEVFDSLIVVFITCSRNSVSLENNYTHDLLSVNYQIL